LTAADGALGQYPSPNEEWHWRFTILKAETLMLQHLNKESLALLEPALPDFLADTDIAVRRKLTQGMAYVRLRQPQEADRLFAEAEALAKAKHPVLLDEVALRKGTLALSVADTASAEREFRECLQLSRQENDPFLEASALGSLGVLATVREHYDEAIDWNSQALKVAQSAGSQSSIVKIGINEGWSYLEVGDFDNALSVFRQAADAAAQTGLLGNQVSAQTNIGNVLFEEKNFDAARAAYEAALVLAKRLDDPEAIVECYLNLALVALRVGQLDQAQKIQAEFSKLLREHPSPSLAPYADFVDGWIAQSDHNQKQAEVTYQKVLQDSAARTQLRWEAELRLAQLYEQEGRAPEADREFQRCIERIEKARGSFKKQELQLSFLSDPISAYDAYIDFLISRGRPNDALGVADVSRARTLAEGLFPRKHVISPSGGDAPLQRMARSSNATLLVYWLGEKHSYLWTVTPTKTAHFTLPPASEIDPLIKSYRELSLKSEDLLQNAAAAGEKLYSTLIEPARKLIAQGSRVILLPDTSLYGLNFETLIVPDPQPHYWIEDVTLTTASSLSMLASSANRSSHQGKDLLLMGDAVPVPEFGPLPQAALEIQKIQPYFQEKNRTVLTGQQATPTGYTTSQPGRFTYLHFVTHGTASRARPLESAVVLSKEPATDIYKLYARDIVTHPLHAKLVTISACNGSGTRAYSGEGLVGLSWAFLRAGAHNVIGALWEVSDASTPQLMDKMYAELAAGKDPATALRNAKLTLLHSQNVFAKPFYWAPFQLYTGS
jgi:CHAT domain-containing protein/Tfp pilus assembly protein PilF